MKPSKSFIEWINNLKEKSPLFYLIKDDKAVEDARKEAGIEPKSENDKGKEDLDAFCKFQQIATTTVNN